MALNKNLQVLRDILINEQKIYVFGVGRNGKRLQNAFDLLGIPITNFVDSNSMHWNKKINGVICIEPNALRKIDEQSMVFITPNNYFEMEKFLLDIGVKNYKLPEVSNFIHALTANGDYLSKESFHELGHFYSLYPSDEEIETFDFEQGYSKAISDINLNEKVQLDVLYKMSKLYASVPQWDDDNALRYTSNNVSFTFSDAVVLSCMLRIIRPKQVIEVGSGFSSAVMLDTNDVYFESNLKIDFVEPYPDKLKSIMRHEDSYEIHMEKMQNMPLEFFSKLKEGDVLFIDSTRVSKMGSDVNFLFFELLPNLNSGVYIHIHDVFYPFEYPKAWLEEGRVWNELYVLRAFLQNNSDYEIVFFQNLLEKKHGDTYMSLWPFKSELNGGSLWLRKK